MAEGWETGELRHLRGRSMSEVLEEGCGDLWIELRHLTSLTNIFSKSPHVLPMRARHSVEEKM